MTEDLAQRLQILHKDNPTLPLQAAASSSRGPIATHDREVPAAKSASEAADLVEVPPGSGVSRPESVSASDQAPCTWRMPRPSTIANATPKMIPPPPPPAPPPPPPPAPAVAHAGISAPQRQILPKKRPRGQKTSASGDKLVDQSETGEERRSNASWKHKSSPDDRHESGSVRNAYSCGWKQNDDGYEWKGCSGGNDRTSAARGDRLVDQSETGDERRSDASWKDNSSGGDRHESWSEWNAHHYKRKQNDAGHEWNGSSGSKDRKHYRSDNRFEYKDPQNHNHERQW